ncbi:hypothetical protein M758_UG140300 [Ceratodon purpureus]|nr:hypothetical protein M758_UG140300 [Ceratodon purpureus]
MDQEYGHGGFKKQIRSLVLGLQTQPSCPESTECAEKVEAMLSTAVLHLADLWNMLTLEFSEGVAFDPDTALLTPVAEIPPGVLTAMRSKLENSLEWCQLARSRLRDITQLSNSTDSSSSPSIKRASSFPSTTRHLKAQQLNNSNNQWQSGSNGAMGSESKFTNFASPSPRSQVGVQNV